MGRADSSSAHGHVPTTTTQSKKAKKKKQKGQAVPSLSPLALSRRFFFVSLFVYIALLPQPYPTQSPSSTQAPRPVCFVPVLFWGCCSVVVFLSFSLCACVFVCLNVPMPYRFVLSCVYAYALLRRYNI